eukprot:58185-Pelagomonas_calceolata.AAC.2
MDEDAAASIKSWVDCKLFVHTAKKGVRVPSQPAPQQQESTVRSRREPQENDRHTKGHVDDTDNLSLISHRTRRKLKCLLASLTTLMPLMSHGKDRERIRFPILVMLVTLITLMRLISHGRDRERVRFPILVMLMALMTLVSHGRNRERMHIPFLETCVKGFYKGNDGTALTRPLSCGSAGYPGLACKMSVTLRHAYDTGYIDTTQQMPQPSPAYLTVALRATLG